MKVVFMGTPDFSVPCLERLISDGHNIAGVFCREDKPVGRKHVLTCPPVKICAEKFNIPVFQPVKLRNNPDAINIIKEINPDIIVVVAYGRILPKEVLEIPKYGCVNIHGSLLPKYRGASPIQWSIVCGDKVTGVTSMLMDEGLDTGGMLIKSNVEISDDDTAETLFEKLKSVGADVLSKTVTGLKNGTVTPIKQPADGVSFAPIITKEMGKLDFNKTSSEIDCLIRGFTPWPSTYFEYNSRRFKINSAVKSTEVYDKKPGTVIFSNGRMFIVCGKKSAIEITEICPEGKKAMDIKSFINGHFISDNTVI